MVKITFYRVMSEEEFLYLQNNSMKFWTKRYKFFTPYLDFIMLILDSNFNNRNIKKERYTHIVQFKFENLSKIKQINKREIILDRQDMNGVKFSYKLINVLEG